MVDCVHWEALYRRLEDCNLGLEVGYWGFWGWLLWLWRLGTVSWEVGYCVGRFGTLGASLVVQRWASNGAPCSAAAVPNAPPLLLLCSALALLHPLPCSCSALFWNEPAMPMSCLLIFGPGATHLLTLLRQLLLQSYCVGLAAHRDGTELFFSIFDWMYCYVLFSCENGLQLRYTHFSGNINWVQLCFDFHFDLLVFWLCCIL